jgi:DNA adenine methylase
VAAEVEARPFLKWAGGKRQLLAQLRRFYPAEIQRYFEPFVGSGAVFFDLYAAGKIQGVPVTLSDENADLIGTYLRVRDSTAGVITALETLAEGHRRGAQKHYYDVRDRQFNPARDVWRAGGGRPCDYPTPLAAMLIYLNRTGYNGLFRLNASGHFNVPAGRYDNPQIVNARRLEMVATVLAQPTVTIEHAPFEQVVSAAGPGDLVYFDPPYAPLSATANFRNYTAGGFSADDQLRLRDVVVGLAAKGVSVILSNSTAPSIIDLYAQQAAERVGLRAWSVPARRAINSRGNRRGTVDELIVSNMPDAAPPSPDPTVRRRRKVGDCAIE